MEVIEQLPPSSHSSKSQKLGMTLRSPEDSKSKNFTNFCETFILNNNNSDYKPATLMINCHGRNDREASREEKIVCLSAEETKIEKVPPADFTWTNNGANNHSSGEIYENIPREDVASIRTWNGMASAESKSDGRGRRKTPKIEVCQKDFKTVVKISVKETPAPEEEETSSKGESRFDYYNEENIYENGLVHLAEKFANANANVSSANKEESNGDGMIYENVSVSQDAGNCSEENTPCEYQNIFFDGSLYVNVNENDIEKNFEENPTDRAKETKIGMIAANGNDIHKDCDIGEKGAYENLHCSPANETFHRNCERNVTRVKGENCFEKKSADATEYKRECKEEDANGSKDPFDSGTSSDVDSLPTSHVQVHKGNVVVTIKALQATDETKKEDEGHRRAESFTSSGVGVDSDESDDDKSNISCDSLNGSDPYAQPHSDDHGYHTPNSEDKAEPSEIYENLANDSICEKISGSEVKHTDVAEPVSIIYDNFFEKKPFRLKKKPPPPPPPQTTIPRAETENGDDDDDNQKYLPKNLLRDIESRTVRLSSTYPNGESKGNGESTVAKVVQSLESNLQTKIQEVAEIPKPAIRTTAQKTTSAIRGVPTPDPSKNNVKVVKVNKICAMEVDTDQFYKFHVSENFREENRSGEDETFAGIKDYFSREKSAAITSAKGTIRGVKNRVKAGIATFLQMQENKSYKDKDAGKVVVYTTTMGIVRETYHKCLKVKQILRTLMVKFEERDVFMSSEAQEEIRNRMKCDAILVPQVFVEGQHIGDAETIERLNELGELRTILKPYRSPDACTTCKVCGGYRLLPCSVCKGSKKSVHRNNFTAEFVSLKCMNCDQVGLVKCHAC